MASYELLKSYAGESLIQGFDFISTTDSSHGFVSYQSYDDAVAQGLVSINSNNQVILTADTNNTYNPDGSQGGRPSVRVESTESYNEVLVIGDFEHMPGSTCGVWPAFWMYGPNWPNDGEIDIIEGANMAYQNLISAHTSAGCSLPSEASWTGTQEETDCSNTDGCNYVPPSSDTSSYGDSFNAIGGGVYALLWKTNTIQVWHFPRGSIPEDISIQEPDPSGWGTAQALFGLSSCNVSDHFADMSIVLNIDFCGDYAGNTWGTGTCSGYAATCETWVGNNPSKLTDLYWEVNYINVYSPILAPLKTPSPVAQKSSTAASQPSSPPELSSNIPKSSNSVPKISTGVSGIPTGVPEVSASVRVSGIAASAKPTSIAINPNNAFNGSNAAAPTSVVVSGGGVVPSGATAGTVLGSVFPEAGSNPANVNSFAYLGCFSSTSGYSAFTLADTDSDMTLEDCTDLCLSSKYAAVENTQCYCANTLDAGTSSVANRSSCNTLCPGDDMEYCGSSSAGLRSVYINNNAVSSTTPPPAPAMAGNVTSNSDSEVPITGSQSSDEGAPPDEASQGNAVQSGASQVDTTTEADTSTTIPGTYKAITTVALTSLVIYTTLCSTNPAHLVTVTTTLTFCPNDPSDPSVPQTTVTQSCDGCGVNKESVVTLTIPLALVSSPTASNSSPEITSQDIPQIGTQGVVPNNTQTIPQASPQVNPQGTPQVSPYSVTQPSSQAGLHATPAYVANATTAAVIPPWTPGAAATSFVPVQASAPKVKLMDIGMMIMAGICVARFLI